MNRAGCSDSRVALRDLVLEAVERDGRCSRADVLLRVAGRLGRDPGERKLRAQVAAALRALEAEGLLVDGGPEVYRS